MKVKLPVKPVDIAVILAAFFLTAFSVWKVYAHPQDSFRVSIRGGSGEWVFPLDAEETVRVEGPLGTTVVQIHDGAARVVSSPCANQSCVAAGPAGTYGDWTACLPNNVFLVIEGTGDNDENSTGVDSVAW